MATRRPLTTDPITFAPTTLGAADALAVPKIAGNSAAPTFTLAGVANASVTASTTANDLAGVLTITLPTIAIATALTITCTAAAAWPTPPVVLLTQFGVSLFNVAAVGNPTQSAASTAGWSVVISLPILTGGGSLRLGYLAMA